MPFVVLLWVMLNIASTLSPLEAQAGFYHWMVALPSHEAYSVLMTIWSAGAHNRLYRALPVLFPWWPVANVTTSITHIRACHLAYKLDQEERAGLDVETGLTPGEGAKEDPAPLQNTLTTATTRTWLERERTVEDVALERRQVYGPSIPPFA
ncbi:uncharacterized protein K460DRAFT_132011 [Cucurbitaria berberidis CBS 394.84]|uniref:DUF3533 domain-containing protein n=1 Tax=Cucurbitaria berberidis CBS 394.84 TaxID=1168544 RepID=A0A9P4GJM2_9PLEO|nr:uncharacterized protein K460DRAFT_132011 [Cucurbitaria berberidis CBS 394.84]KAF1846842.1 hypothetical protein K460DRAFT_132011 [Cucurbitaria berberidis CBS 394.84]